MACILLGAGIPTTATYIVLVSIAAPALGLLGVAPIVAVGVQVEVEVGMIPRSGANPTAIKPTQ